VGWFGLKQKRDAEREFMERVFSHWEGMYRFALRLSGSEAEAQDLVQEAMAKALQHFERMPIDTHWRAWAYTIVRNAFVSKARKSGRESLLEDADLLPSASDKPVASATVAPVPTLEAFRAGFEDEVLAALMTLPEGQRTAVVLCDIEGLDYEEIAHVLDCPVGTVRSRIHHARKRLREALATYASQRGYGDVQAHR
jgi:RNA polymerase sigma-70 factor (ECF subfamily)